VPSWLSMGRLRRTDVAQVSFFLANVEKSEDLRFELRSARTKKNLTFAKRQCVHLTSPT